jgi:hypothetical protein
MTATNSLNLPKNAEKLTNILHKVTRSECFEQTNKHKKSQCFLHVIPFSRKERLASKNNKHSESIASNTKSPTSGIFNQDSSSRTKLNFDF